MLAVHRVMGKRPQTTENCPLAGLVTCSILIVAILLQFPTCSAFLSSPCWSFDSLKSGALRTSSSRRLENSNDFSLRAVVVPDAETVARGLGYAVAAGSLALYTPIALRVQRKKSADGLTLSTWWIKLSSYTCSDVYAYTHSYPFSQWGETLIITIEAAIILILATFYQKKMGVNFFLGASAFCASVVVLLNAPAEVIALGQTGSALLNVIALFPQFAFNARHQTSGDYSPITAGLAAVGCAVRLFTTVQLADSDPILLGTFGLALVLNSSMFAQILWYGVKAEGQDVFSVLTSDFRSRSKLDESEGLFLIEPKEK